MYVSPGASPPSCWAPPPTPLTALTAGNNVPVPLWEHLLDGVKYPADDGEADSATPASALPRPRRPASGRHPSAIATIPSDAADRATLAVTTLAQV